MTNQNPDQNTGPHKANSPGFPFSAKGSQAEAMGLPEWGLGLVPIVFWGSAFYFVAEALEDMHPGALTWIRIMSGAAFLYFLPVKKQKHSISGKDWVRIWILAFFWIAFPFTLFALAQQWIDSSLAGMLVGAQPIFAAIMASFFLKTLPQGRNTLGLCFGLAGLTLAAWPSLISYDSGTVGVCMVIVAVLGYGFCTNFVIPMAQSWGGLFVIQRVLILSSIMTAPFGVYGIAQTHHTPIAYIAVLILGIGATALTPFAFSELSARVGATRASSVNFLVPLVALYLGAFVRDETIHGLSLIGLGLILAGMGIMSGRDDKH